MADRTSWLARAADLFRAPKQDKIIVPSNQMDVVSQFVAGRPVEPESIDLRKMIDEGYRRNVIIYVCVNEIASSAAAPRVYLRDRKTQDEIEEHELLDLIARPYPGGSWYDLIERLLIFQQVTGTGYLHKGRSGASQIVQLTAARSDRIQPVPDKQGNILYYEYKIEGGDKQRVEPEDLAAFRLPDPLNDFHGLSPLTVAAVFGDIDTAAAVYLRDFFANGAMPMGLLKFKTPSVRREDRLRVQQEWSEQYGATEISPKNAGRWHNVGVIGGDVDYVPLGAEPAQLRLDAVWGMTESRLCATFGVPPAIVQARIGLQFSTYSNQREARRSFWTETLVPIYRRIADGMTRNLVSEYDEDLELVFDLESIPELQEDLNQRATRATALFLGGVASFNEARLLSDLEEAKTDFYAFPGTVTMVPREDVETGKYFTDAAESKKKAEDALASKAAAPPFGGAPGEKPPPFGKKPKPGEEPVPPKKGEPPAKEGQAEDVEDEHGLPFEIFGLGKIPPESEREIQRATESLERGFSEAVRESVAGSDLPALAAALARGDWRAAERAVDTAGYVRRYGAALADHLYAETDVALGLHYRHHAGEPRETHAEEEDVDEIAPHDDETPEPAGPIPKRWGVAQKGDRIKITRGDHAGKIAEVIYPGPPFHVVEFEDKSRGRVNINDADVISGHWVTINGHPVFMEDHGEPQPRETHGWVTINGHPVLIGEDVPESLQALHSAAGSPPISFVDKDDKRLEFGVGGYYDPDTHSIVVPKNAGHVVIAHELGHALDAHLGDRSARPAAPHTSFSDFGSKYRADQEKMDVRDKEYLGRRSYFGTRSESFAEAVAVLKTGDGAGVRGVRFRNAMPNVLAHVESLLAKAEKHEASDRETHGPMSDARRSAKASLKGKWGDKIESRLKLEMKRIDKQARDVVRSQILSVVNGKAEAVTPASIVGHIGLNDRQRATVERARVRLLAEGKLKGNALEKDLDKLRVKLLRERAKGIADYETRLAHSLGRQAAWERLLAEGKLRGGRRHWHKAWLVNESEGTCGECMDLDGEDVPLDDAFSNGSVCPPEHPNCNCEIVLVETTSDWRRTKDAAPGPDEALDGGWATINGHPVFVGGPDDGMLNVDVVVKVDKPSMGVAPSSERMAAGIKKALDAADLPKGAMVGLERIEVKLPGTVDRTVVGTYRSGLRVIEMNGARAEHAREVVHEVGHHVHLYRMTDAKAGEWSKLSEGGSNCRISSYGKTSVGEHFAEAFQAFARGGSSRATLGRKEPASHKFMSGLWAKPGFESVKTATGHRGGAEITNRYHGVRP